jgi:hypothetical protein
MPRTSTVHAVTAIGMDMGKNTLHMVGLDSRGAIVLREKVPRGRITSSGRDGFTWSGVKSIERMSEWPDWIPPADMLHRQPYLPRFMAGGPGNPLGARAMYLGGTVYRIHGTNAPDTIGEKVSSGCIRLVNDDVIDLYGRVHVGTKVVVLPMEQTHIVQVRRSVPSPMRTTFIPLSASNLN